MNESEFDISLYTKSESLLGNNVFSGLKYPVAKKTKPTKLDYENGFVNRYFVKRINEVTPTEVLGENYSSVKNNILYDTVFLKWTISGPKNSVIENGITMVDGVTESNRNTLNSASEVMPELENVLTDLTEFWRGY